MKKKTKKKIIFYLATKLGWIVIKLLGKSCFIKREGWHYIDDLKKNNKRYLYVLWHGRIFIPIYLHRNEGINAMVSLHRDGEMIAHALHKLGYHTVRGSSTRGGNEAFHNMVASLKKGHVGTIIPDGPKGPRHKLKPGTIYIAQQSDAYLVPVSFSADKNFEFKSWDRFHLSFPFSKNVIIYGKPVKVSKESKPEELEKIRFQFEKEMITLEKTADEYFSK